MGDNWISNDQVIDLLYRAILRRDPDEQGRKTFTSQLQQGRTLASIVQQFANCDEFKRHSKLFVPPGHFYSPITDPAELDGHFVETDRQFRTQDLPGIRIDLGEMTEEFNSFLPYLNDIPFEETPRSNLRYGFDNSAYSWGDGSVLYSMLRKYRPRRLIEIGSGWSSACSIDTIDRFLNDQCELIFIEPYPQLLRELLGDAAERVTIYDKPVQTVDLSVFATLEAGDFLFIDSTHIAKTGSDVCYELFQILPALKRGVHVHFHDVFWPFEYPRKWAVEESRSWNELYLLRAFLYNSEEWKITFFNDYFARFEAPLISSLHPDFLRNSGGALWLQKCGI